MGFRAIDIQNCTKFSADNFFSFLSFHYGFMNCYEILNFVFSIIPRGVSTCNTHSVHPPTPPRVRARSWNLEVLNFRGRSEKFHFQRKGGRGGRVGLLGVVYVLGGGCLIWHPCAVWNARFEIFLPATHSFPFHIFRFKLCVTGETM